MGTLKQERRSRVGTRCHGSGHASCPSRCHGLLLPTPSEGFWIILQTKQPQTRSEQYAGEPVHGTRQESHTLATQL